MTAPHRIKRNPDGDWLVECRTFGEHLDDELVFEVRFVGDTFLRALFEVITHEVETLAYAPHGWECLPHGEWLFVWLCVRCSHERGIATAVAVPHAHQAWHDHTDELVAARDRLRKEMHL